MRRRKNEIYTTLGIERDEFPDEIIVEVYGEFIPGERQYFNVMSGEGHPGCPADAEFVWAEYLGKPFDLTEEEKERAVEALLEQLQEEEDVPYSDRYD